MSLDRQEFKKLRLEVKWVFAIFAGALLFIALLAWIW